MPICAVRSLHHDAGNDRDSRALRISAGRERRVFDHAARADGESVFHSLRTALSPDPAELVANGRLKLFLQRVEPLFDWIIIDSPPAIPVSDASVLANSCDGVLMVVRSNATPSISRARRAQEFRGQASGGSRAERH